MPDWTPEMAAILAALDRARERRRWRKDHPITYLLPDGTPAGKPPLRIRGRYFRKRNLARLNGLLCRSRRWRRFQFGRHHVDGCTCIFEDAEVYHHSSHPTSLCPLRTHCGGYDGPCGGCDDCIDDQQDYYEAKDRGTI